MRRLREAIRQKCTELWENQWRILQRDFLAKNKTVIMTQPLYSPDLALAEFFPLPKTEDSATIEEIKEKSKQELLAIPKSAFQKCFKDWKKRWHKCILSEKDYFEGDKIVIDK